MRFGLAFLLLAHGVAHAVGFVVSWRIRTFPEMPYRTTVLGDLIDVGTLGTRVLGVAWLAMAIAFAVVAAGVVLRVSWWTHAAVYVFAVSFVLCVIGWPDARLGILANVVIGGLAIVAIRSGWI